MMVWPTVEFDFDPTAYMIYTLAHLRQTKAVVSNEGKPPSDKPGAQTHSGQASPVILDNQLHFVACVVLLHADVGRLAP